MAPLLLVLSLWGPSSPAPRLTAALVPRLRPPFAAIVDASPPAPPAPAVPFTFALGEAGAGAGALAVGEGVYGLLGFAILAATGFPGIFSSPSGAQIAILIPLALIGFLGFPTLTVAAAYVTGTLNGDPRPPNLQGAIIGAFIGAGLGGGVGILYGIMQNTFNLSGAPETTAALLALAFQLVAIPVGAVIGLHWGAADAVGRPVETVPPSSTPPQLLPPPSVPPDSPNGPPPISAPRAAAHVTVLSISFG